MLLMLKGGLLNVCKAIKVASSQRAHLLRVQRSLSAWIDPTKAGSSSRLESIDVERLFTSAEVQRLLLELTGVDLEKVFAERVFDKQERSHFALMTEKMFKESLEKMRVEAKYFLQFVPIKEPRETKTEVLSKEPLIHGFDNSKFVFVDITFDATNQNRTVVVRETDGTLRVATPEEHDRMNRIFFAQSERPVNEPAIFKDPCLAEALNRCDHEYVLDYACYFFEPDDPQFVKLYRSILDRTIHAGKFEILRSTRHFGPLIFYMVINDQIDPLLIYFASAGSLTDTANLIRLYKVVHPDWRVAIGTEDTESKIVFDFLKQNRDKVNKLDVVAKLLVDSNKKEFATNQVLSKPTQKPKSKAKLMDKDMLSSSEGPLGELASSYSVVLSKGTVKESPKQSTRENQKISLNRHGNLTYLQKARKKPK